MAVRIITDSSSDITAAQLHQLNAEMLSMPIQFGEESFLAGIDLSNDEFYQKLLSSPHHPTTSQPPLSAFLNCFEQARDCGDEVVIILLSGALSGTTQTAAIAREMCGHEPIYIVDSRNATAGLLLLVEHACRLRDHGLSGREIAQALEELKPYVRIFAVIDTLEYLRRGGRLSNLAANLGTVTKLKPTIAVRDGAVDVVGKSFGTTAAVKQMLKLMEAHPIDHSFPVRFLYTDDQSRADYLLPKMREAGLLPTEPDYFCVGPTIGTHIGPGGLGIAYVEKH